MLGGVLIWPWVTTPIFGETDARGSERGLHRPAVDLVSGFSRLERYDSSRRRDVRLEYGAFRRAPADTDAPADDFHLILSDQPLPDCLDLTDTWTVDKEVAGSGRTIVFLRLRLRRAPPGRDGESAAGDWSVTARVFDPHLEGFESVPAAAFEIEAEDELVAGGGILGRIRTAGKIQVSVPVWFMTVLVDLPLEGGGDECP